MTNRTPLTFNRTTQKLEELPIGVGLDITGSDIVAVRNITASGTISTDQLLIQGSPVLTEATNFSLSYNNLTDRPTIPTRLSDLENDTGFITQDNQTLSLVGSTLSIQNGNSVNLSGIVPQNISSFANDLDYVTLQQLQEGITVQTSGDIIGSIFGEDSALLVDSVDSKIVGPVDNISVRTRSITGAGNDFTISPESGRGLTIENDSHSIELPQADNLLVTSQAGIKITTVSGVPIIVGDGTAGELILGHATNLVISRAPIIGNIHDSDRDTKILLESSYQTDEDTIEFYTANNNVLTLDSDSFTIRTAGFIVPVGDDAGRPANTVGSVRFNTDRTAFEGYDGIAWNSLGGVIDVDQDTFVRAEDYPGADNDEIDVSVAGNIVASFNSQGLEINTTGYLKIPSGTTLQRGSADTGNIRYNTSDSQFEGYDGSNWSSLGGTRDVDQDTQITAESSPGADEDTLEFFAGGNNVMSLDSDNLEIKIDGLVIPAGSTAERPTPIEGHVRFNTDLTSFEGYNGEGWGTLGGVIDIDQDTFIIPENRPGANDDTLYFSVAGTTRARLTDRGFDIGDYRIPLEDGTVNQILMTDGAGKASWVNPDSFGGNRVYVSKALGDDSNDGVTAPVSSIKRAVQIASGMAYEPTNSSVSKDSQSELLRANAAFLANEAILYVNAEYFAYNEEKLREDTGLTIDGVGFDLVLGTNYNSVTIGLAYARGSLGLLLPEQKTETIGAITTARSLTAAAITDSTDTATSNSLYNEVIDILNNGEGAADSLTFTNPTDASAGQIAAKDQLINNRTFLQAEIIAWLGDKYPNLTFNSSKCSRDVGYIVDALTYDILYGGNSATVQSARSYYLGSTSQLGIDQDIATAAAYRRLISVVADVVTDVVTSKTATNSETQDVSAGAATSSEVTALTELLEIYRTVILDGNIANLPSEIYPDVAWASTGLKASRNEIVSARSSIIDGTISFINSTYSPFTYDEARCRRDYLEIIDSVIYDLRFGGNSRSRNAGLFYYDAEGNPYITGQVTETVDGLTYLKSIVLLAFSNQEISTVRGNLSQTFDDTVTTEAGNSTIIGDRFDTIIDIVQNGTGVAPSVVHGTFRTKEVTVQVATGDYSEDNPIIVSDNVSVVGDNLRRVLIRPINANRDILRVRNSSYIFNVTFRDKLNENGVPSETFRYAISFDNPAQTSTSRAGYQNLPTNKPLITTSPYIQNCSVISFLAGNGVEIDGDLVTTPNTPINAIEAENPVDLADGVPEQGKSMVANAFTILSFGGNAWRVINEAYAQIVSCFVIFTGSGCLTQNGGYLSITNSASNFGLFSLRSSGYSPNSFEYDRGIIWGNSVFETLPTLRFAGLRRRPTEHYVIRVFNQADSDITDTFNQNSTLGKTANFTASGANASGSTISFGSAHGFSSGERVEYLSNGNPEIKGLFNELTYFAEVPNANQIILFEDEDRTIPVRGIDGSVSFGTHTFRSGFEELFIEEVVTSHNEYQRLTIPSGSYSISIGDTITGTNGAKAISAVIVEYGNEASNDYLIVSIEQVQEGVNLVRNKFISGSTIDAGEITANAVTIGTVLNITDLFSAECTIRTTQQRPVQNIALARLNKVNLHRPSICNSSAHTWEFAGSGTDYNALPQNGGNSRSEFQQKQDLPGRVYSSGTNELGDFLVGDFVQMFNRTGNINFNNNVSIGELDSLALSLSGGITVSEISSDIDLGDNEFEGPKNERLVTQLAVRSFLDNRLGNFIDKNVSTNAVPSAVVQLNSQGLINSDLIPPSGNFNSFIVPQFEGRFDLDKDIPAANVTTGDIAIEEYEQLTLTTSNPIAVTKGETITQASTGATGVAKTGDGTTTTSTIILVEPIGNFNTTNELTGSISGALGTDSIPTTVSAVNEQSDNYFINTSRVSQFLILQNETYDFTDIINNQTPLQGAVSGAVGTVDEYVEGVLVGVDIANDIPGGSGYSTPGTYTDVAVQSLTGSGTGARVNIIVGATGTIESFDLIRGGSDYSVGDEVGVAASDVGGNSGVELSISVIGVENRLFVQLNSDVGIEFAATPINLEFLFDDNVNTIQIDPQTASFQRDFDAADFTSTGDVDYTNSIIKYPTAHGFANGDSVVYESNGNPALGGLLNGNTFFVRVISSTDVELYTDYGLNEDNKVIFTSGSTGTHFLRVDIINTVAESIYISNHGLTTGAAIQYTVDDSSAPPAGINDGDYLFVGSVTQNTFTLHQTRGAALDSVNGIKIAPVNVSTQGSGIAILKILNVVAISDINTSGRLESSWSSLTTTTLDASNIISGLVDTSRLASGPANNDTFLRGDQSWSRAVQGLTREAPVTITGSNFTDGNDTVYYDRLNISVELTSQGNPTPGVGNETVGVASFDFGYFEVDANGKVTTKDANDGGQIDSLTLVGQAASFYLDPINLSSTVPIERGGLNQNSWTAGDLLYAATNLGNNTYSESMSALAIGSNKQILVSNGSVPIWSSTITSGDIQIGITASTEIDTVSGNLTIDSAGGTTTLDDNVTVSGVLKVSDIETVSGNLTIDSVGGTTTIDDNVTITGNLTVNGSTTTVNTETVTIADNIILLNSNASGSASQDAGFEIERGDDANKSLLWNETADKWTVGFETFVAGTFEGNLTGNVTGNVSGNVTGDLTGNVTGNVAGNVTGDVKSGNGVTVLDSGSTGNDAVFTGNVTGNLTGNIRASNGVTVLNNGTTGANATFTGNVSGNVTGNVTGQVSDISNHSTTDLTEDTNLYYTDTRARNSVSATGDLSYDPSTGVFSFTERTDAEVRGLVSATGDISYNSSTGVFSFTERTDAQVRGLISGGTGVTYNSNTGTFSIGQAVGTGNSVTFAGITVPSVTKSGTNGTGDIGQSNNKFGTVFANTFSGTATEAQYADLAENYLADDNYEPGTVLILGGEAEITSTDVEADVRVIGVVTTAPAHLMNSALTGSNVTGIALRGRVPCKVTGTVQPGDILVSSSYPGYAVKAEDANSVNPLAVIGKAISSKNSEGFGTVEIVV